jgi:hypothetical protein
MPEYSLRAVLDVGGGANLEIGEVNYDRAYRADLRVGVDGDLQIAGEEYDRAIKGAIDSGSMANIEIEPQFDRTHKATIEVRSEDFVVKPSVARWMKADLAVGPTGTVVAKPVRDICLTAPVQDVGKNADLSANPGVDRYFLGSVNAGGSADFTVQNLMRRVLGLPPRGSISLISDEGAKELNGCAIAPGSTKILELEVTGSRLDCYRVHFMVALEPSHFATQENLLINRVYDPKQPGIGGITVRVPIHEETTDRGKEEQAIYQIILLPSDTNIGDKSRTVFYSARLADGPPNQIPLVYGELYRLEEGRFTIALDGTW